MFIEKELRSEFEKISKSIKEPDNIKNNAQLAFKHYHSNKKRIRNQWFSKLAISMACLLIFSGFAYAANIIYELTFDSFEFNISDDPMIDIPSLKEREHIQNTIEDIRESLKPGESAIMYSSALDNGQNVSFSLATINNPEEISMEDWQNHMDDYFSQYKIPQALYNGMTLKAAHYQTVVGGVEPEMAEKYYDTLKARSTKTTEKITWYNLGSLPLKNNSLLDLPNLIYETDTNDEILITYHLLTDDVVSMTSYMGEDFKQFTVDGNDAFYVEPNESLYTTNKEKILSWIENRNGQLILYNITTESVNITQEDLIAIANNMEIAK
ncbi:hypothetical protein [Cytobacillus sp. IB215665]|uniref:hypothetical protein n=1 Tax=Cytobacillus sp. IB215665 TaxID=3097357 RepID=UPI002A10E163|nr:hypothetical protein [Cytobacillus sp. IB215665]MDX8366398.1 hypothetical protein [Cytobacillus sp. IB215665]